MLPERQDADLDALRRRLYGPDATPADLHRYLAERPTPSPDPEGPEQRERPARAPVRGVLLAMALLVAVAGIPIALLAEPGARTTPTTTSAAVRVEDVGGGRVLRVVAGPSTRAVTSIRGVAVEGRRFSGRGSAVVPVPPGAGFGTGGRMRVIVTAPNAVVRWRALMIVRADGRTSYPLVVARGVADGPSSAGGSGTFVYAEVAPTRIVIDAPRSARWTLVVAVRHGLREGSG